jgi:DNA polymerase-1
MRSYTDEIQGTTVTTMVATVPEDLPEFLDWAYAYAHLPIAIDTESTGFRMFSVDWKLRLVQFGTKREAWVIPVEEGYEDFRSAVQEALGILQRPVAHNLPFDALSLERAGYKHPLWRIGSDTSVMAHLIDPRGRPDGGVGQGLKPLGEFYLDPAIRDGEKEFKDWARKAKVPVDERFLRVPFGEPSYEHYAGLDCIITAGLFELFSEKLGEKGLEDLAKFEYATQEATADMQRRGFLLDVPYAEALREYLLDQEDILLQKLQHMGIDNPNSNAQVRKALLASGAKLTVETPSGELSVSADALDGIDHPAVAMVQEYAQVGKFRTSYVDAMLEAKDSEDRIHPSIRALKARTARMAVSDPPLHQLPSRDAMIRRMLVADPGHVLYAVDYDQVELRILAVMAGAKKMIAAIHNGIDLHTTTAELVGIERRLAKMVNFLIVYGGGAGKLSIGAKVPFEEARAALKGFHRAYPEIKRYGNRLQERSGQGARPIETPSGRLLPLDKDRTYAATNYMVQSTARDVLAEAILRLRDDDEIWGGVLLPVHDEVIGQAPLVDAANIVNRVGEIMSTDFGEVELSASGKILGRSWGHGYDIESLPKELRRFA